MVVAEETGAILDMGTDDKTMRVPESAYDLPFVVVPDSYRLGFFIFGVAMLLPWNAFLSSLDYYALVFPDVPVGVAFSVPYMWSMYCNALLLQVFPPKRLGLATIIGLSLFVIMTAAMPAIAPSHTVRGTDSISLRITLGSAAVVGLTDSVVQSSLFASAAMFPGSSCTQALNAGGGLAGVVVALVRILTLILFSPTSNSTTETENMTLDQAITSLRPSVGMFFWIGSCICAIALLIFIRMTRTSLWYSRIAPQNDHSEQSPSKTIWEQIDELRITLFDVAVPTMSVFLVFTLTLGLFPAIFSDLPRTATGVAKTKTSFIVGQVLLFCIGDFLGKSSPVTDPRFGFSGPGGILRAAVARYLFIPVTMAIARSWWVPGDNYVLFLTFLFGLTNGICAGAALIAGPASAPVDRKGTAGRLMFLSLISGLAVGAALGAFLKALIFVDA